MTSAILLKLSGKHPEVLTNPESILGPNATKVLEFWRTIGGLSEDELEEMEKLYLSLDNNVRVAAGGAADDVAKDVVGKDFRDDAWCAAVDVTGCGVFGWATEELIGGVENKVFYGLIVKYKNSLSV